MSAPQTLEPSEGDTVLRGEREILELIATGSELSTVLDAICRLIDEPSGLKSSVYLLDREGRTLTFVSGPEIPEAWQRVTASFPAAAGHGACGEAVSRREPVILEHVQTNPLLSHEWRDAARSAGIDWVWSTPFCAADGHPLGTFALVSEGPRPAEAQRQRVGRAAYLASIAVERHQTERDLRESERRFSTAFYSGPAAMSISRFADGRFLYVNDKFVTVFEHSRADVTGKTALSLDLWANPEERDAMWRAIEERGAVHDFEAKARTRSGKILDLLFWGERIQILGDECLLAIACDITDRKRTEEALTQGEHLLRVVLDSLPVGVAVMNRAGDIVLSNPASRGIWGGTITDGEERWAKSRGWWLDSGKPVEPHDWASVRALTRGERSTSERLEIETFDGVRKIIENSAVPIRNGGGAITGAVIINADISARERAERELHDSLTDLRALTGRLMRAQDDERRRIAQMLHETTAQDLAALKMQLARLTRTASALSDDSRAALAEGIELAERSMTSIRTLSYLLHPPFLDEAGLLSALRWYAEGFAERSGIAVDLDLPAAFARLPQDVETALFRVVQEALINIHRHAESPSAMIRLRVDGRQLTLEIEDRGRGLPSDLIAELPTGGGALGVGVVGMRERLQQLGGTLDIQSSEGGTIVRARVPLPADIP